MNIQKTLFFLIVASFLFSCDSPKQYSSCSDIPKSLNGTYYYQLVKKWGEPINKEQRGQDWFVTWSGVGVKGVDKELMFTSTTDCPTCTTEKPWKFEGVECNK